MVDEMVANERVHSVLVAGHMSGGDGDELAVSRVSGQLGRPT